jgi:hypothetical protein
MKDAKEFLKAVNDADISDSAWFDSILSKIENDYARGYITRYAEELGNVLSPTDEEYRESLQELAEYTIWIN